MGTGKETALPPTLETAWASREECCCGTMEQSRRLLEAENRYRITFEQIGLFLEAESSLVEDREAEWPETGFMEYTIYNSEGSR